MRKVIEIGNRGGIYMYAELALVIRRLMTRIEKLKLKAMKPNKMLYYFAKTAASNENQRAYLTVPWHQYLRNQEMKS
jgi:isochorismate hydrolase